MMREDSTQVKGHMSPKRINIKLIIFLVSKLSWLFLFCVVDKHIKM